MTATKPLNDLELVRFLLARLDDDESELKRIARKQTRGTGPASLVVTGPHTLGRMRAECTSKRQLIGTLQQLLVLRDQPFEKAIRDAATQMLHAMAVPYSEHSAFRAEWAHA